METNKVLILLVTGLILSWYLISILILSPIERIMKATKALILQGYPS